MATRDAKRVLSIQSQSVDKLSPSLKIMRASLNLTKHVAGAVFRTIGRIAATTGRIVGRVMLSPFRLLGKVIGGILSPLGVFRILMGSVIVVALKRFVSIATEAADTIEKFSIQLGFSKQSLQELRFIADRQGVSFTTLSKSAKTMAVNLSDAARGTGEAREAFDQLGISARDLINLTPEQQFAAILGAMSKVESQTKRLAFANDIFGGRATELLRILQLNEEGFERLRLRAHELSAVLSDEEVNALVKLKDAATDVRFAFTGLVSGIVLALEPVLTRGLDFVSKLVSKVTAQIRVAAAVIRDAFDPDSSTGAAAREALAGLGEAFGDAASSIGVGFAQSFFAAFVLVAKAAIPVVADLVGTALGDRIVDAMVPALQHTLDTMFGGLFGDDPFGFTQMVKDAREWESGLNESAMKVQVAIRDRLPEVFIAVSRIAAETRDRMKGDFRDIAQAWDHVADIAEQAGVRIENATPTEGPGFSPLAGEGFLGGAIEGVKEFGDAINRTFEEGKKAGSALATTFESGLGNVFESLIDGTASVGDAFAQMGRDILKVIAQIVARQAALAIVTSLFGPPAGAAKGAVVRDGVMSKFARGGVIDRPIVFPLRRGTGMAGEGGRPEMIAPLFRDRHGDLGVKTDGGGGDTVNVTVNAHAADAEGMDRVLAKHARTIEDITLRALNQRRDFRLTIGTSR